MKPHFRIVEQDNGYQDYLKYVQEYYFSGESTREIREKLDISNVRAIKFNKQLLREYGVIRDQFSGKLVKKVDKIPIIEEEGCEQDYFNHPEMSVFEIMKKYNFTQVEWKSLAREFRNKHGMHRIQYHSFGRYLSDEEIRDFRDFVREDLKVC